MKGGFNCYGCHTKSVNIRQRFRRRQSSLLCRNCDIFVIVAAAVYKCAVKLYRVCKEERVYSPFKEEEGGWQKERGGREKEKERAIWLERGKMKESK